MDPMEVDNTPATPESHRSNVSGRDLSPNQENDPPRNPNPIRFDQSPARQSEASVTSHQNENVIWGTNINVSDSMHSFRKFLNEFKLDPTHGSAYYATRLLEIKESQNYNLNIDCMHLKNFKRTEEVYDQLIKYPQEIVPIFDMVVFQEFQDIWEGEDEPPRIQVRTFNLEYRTNMRNLNPCDVDTLVAIRGMVIRTSNLIPDLKQAFFRCGECGEIKEVDLDRGRIDHPNKCDSGGGCNKSNTFEIVHNRSVFANRQLIKMQESPENVTEGETPQTITLHAFDELVDIAKPGDRVEITGIYRAHPIRVSSKQRALKSVYKTYVDVLHIRKTDSQRFSVENSTADEKSEFYTPFEENNRTNDFAEEHERKMKEIGASPDVYDNLMNSVCPNIWEYEDVKKGVLCLLFGGTNKLDREGFSKCRGEINMLMCGDPGTAKSQMLGYIHKIAPRGIYTSGKGSSAVGLTAFVTKDPDTREMVLESGALVLSDRGVCCIDEFDKMSDSTRSVLHEVMEQQTISIAKAGIICTLNARTSILASANPIESRYNPSLSVVQNIQLPPTLLSRFDLIYLILDKPNADSDRRLAKHLVSLYYENSESRRSSAPLDRDTLTSYISYARQNCNPTINDQAAKALIKGYVDMRKIGRVSSSKKIVTATPRQLESLIRLSEALAKMRLSDEVTANDVAEAIRLMNVATQKAATDPRTGAIDMDMITTGHSAMSRENLQDLIKAVRDIINEKIAGSENETKLAIIERHLQSDSAIPVSSAELTEALHALAEDGFLVYNENRKTVRKIKSNNNNFESQNIVEF